MKQHCRFVAVFCGALIVFTTAARNDCIDAAVWYHGADAQKYLGEVDGLHSPILMHLGEKDEFISETAQAAIKAALVDKPNASVTAAAIESGPLFRCICRVGRPWGDGISE